MWKLKVSKWNDGNVVNVYNYIGESTNKEIEYAKSLGKEIIYYTDLIKWD